MVDQLIYTLCAPVELEHYTEGIKGTCLDCGCILHVSYSVLEDLKKVPLGLARMRQEHIKISRA